MAKLDLLKPDLETFLQSCGVNLYAVQWLRQGSERTLQVAIMKPDGSLDLNTCAEVSEKLSAWLDEHDPSEASYTLEVCSPGAEREIRDLSELEHMPDPYVFIRLIHPVNRKKEFTGTITSIQDGVYTLSYRDKAVLKTLTFTAADLEYIRLAVRF